MNWAHLQEAGGRFLEQRPCHSMSRQEPGGGNYQSECPAARRPDPQGVKSIATKTWDPWGRRWASSKGGMVPVQSKKSRMDELGSAPVLFSF